MTFRVFNYCYGWCDAMLLFDMETTFKDIIENPSTAHVKKEDFIGIYEFDEKFVNTFFDKQIKGNLKYFSRNMYQKDYKQMHEDIL